MKKIILTCWICFTLSTLSAQTWTGATNDRWDVASNWNNNTVPGPSSAVVIPGTIQAGRQWPRMLENVSINSLVMQTGSQLNTGGFNIFLNRTSGTALNIDGAIVTNPITSNTTVISVADGTTLNTYREIDGSTFNGNFHLIGNALNQTFYEANDQPNTWNGNLTITMLNQEALSLSVTNQSTFNGNVTINKSGSASGQVNIFTNGNVTVAGDLTVNKPIGGLIRIGDNTNTVTVNGRLFFDLRHAGTGSISISRINNNTTGGTVYISRASTLSSVALCNWKVSTLFIDSIIGQFSLNDMDVTGVTEIKAYGSIVGYMSRNTFNGPFSMSLQAGAFYEAYADANAGNVYKGNVVFVQGGTSNIDLGYSDTSHFERDVTFISNTDKEIRRIRFSGNQNATLTMQGQGKLSIRTGEIAKTNDARLILASPLSFTFNNGFTLTSGYIESSASSPVRINNLVSLLGGSIASHVIGPVDKVGIAFAALPFTYPIGSGFTYNPVTQSNHGGNSSVDTFRAQYILQNPGSNGLNANEKAGTLSNVSKAGYWLFNRLSGSRNVNLTFGFSPNPYHQFPAPATLKVAQWNGSIWADLGNGGTTGTNANGTITHTGNLTTYTYFALANNLQETYFYNISHAASGPGGTSVKVKGIQGFPGYETKTVPAGTYTADSIFLLPNGSTNVFKLKDSAGVEKDDTTYDLPAVLPTIYANSTTSGTEVLSAWRHMVHIRNPDQQIIGGIADNNLVLGNTTMQAYFATGPTAIAPNGGQHFLKRSFIINSALQPPGNRSVRLYIHKTELNNLIAANPSAYPAGINSLHIYKYKGLQEDTVFNPRPGGTTRIIPPAAITKSDLDSMWAIDFQVADFSGFYLSGPPTFLSVCPGSNVILAAAATGTTYRWQVNTGNGFSNISNNATYSGVTTSNLTISNAGTNLYGYSYRCVINGSSAVPVTTLRFSTTWQGTVNNVWSNPGNWPCGIVPDGNTDVVIKAGTPFAPIVSANTAVRTLTLEKNVLVQVLNGAILTIVR